MAGSLIETLTGDFDPGRYKDSYREALQAVIDAKIAGREVVQPDAGQPTSGTVVDLMAALRASVAAAKAGRGEAAGDEPPARRTAKPTAGTSSRGEAAGDAESKAAVARTTRKAPAKKTAPRRTA